MREFGRKDFAISAEAYGEDGWWKTMEQHVSKYYDVQQYLVEGSILTKNGKLCLTILKDVIRDTWGRDTSWSFNQYLGIKPVLEEAQQKSMKRRECNYRLKKRDFAFEAVIPQLQKAVEGSQEATINLLQKTSQAKLKETIDLLEKT